jgi:hypothetical protein
MSALCQKRTSLKDAPRRSLLEQRVGTGITRPVPFHFGLTARVAGYLAPQLAGSVSAHVGCPLLPLKIIGTLRLGRQLEHRRLLSLS